MSATTTNYQKQEQGVSNVVLGLKPYFEYRDSGLPWLGQVPGHWEIKRLGALLRERGEKNDRRQVADVLSLMRERGVIPYGEKGRVGNKKSDNITRYKIVRPDDVVVNCMNVIIGSVGISRYTGCLSPVYYVLTRRFEDDNPHYLNAYFQTKSFQLSLVRIGNGILAHRMRIPMELLKCELFPRPPANEQAAIVRFLDYATHRLDKAIRAKRKTIALLNEQKQAIIHRAVTRGLDPAVPLKPSGIDWLGDVPGHWRPSRLSRLSTRIGDGLHGTPQYVDQSPYHFINGNNLVNGNIRLKSSTRCVGEAEFKKHRVALDDRSLLMSINGTIGSVAYYRGESIILGKSAAYINCGRELARPYLFFFLQSPAVVNFLRQEVTGTTIFNLSLASIRCLPIALPSIGEQLKIVSYIENEIAPVDTAISRLNREIDLLREYRTRLIADVVTGKLDVREAAARLPEVEGAPAIEPEVAEMEETGDELLEANA